jgi:hypothetical protein
VLAGPPARESLIDEAIELVQRSAAHATEGVARATDVRMIPLRVIVRHELRDAASEVALAEQHHAAQALLFDRSHERSTLAA